MCLDAVNRAVSSRASDCKEFSRSRLTTPESASNSNHNMLSSASSTTTPSFAAKLSPRPRSARCPIICRHRGAAPEQLLTHDLCLRRLGQRAIQSNHAQGEGLGSFSQLFGCWHNHYQLQITNYKFPITNSYRSISPSTISMLPIAATTSAISRPSHILGSNCKFARHADRTCTRYGFAVPSLTM